MEKYICILMFLLSINYVNAMLNVSVNGGDFQPINITINQFTGELNFSSSLQKIINNDLANSGFFNVNSNNNGYKLEAKVSNKNNELIIKYQLNNSLTKQILLAQQIKVHPQAWRYAAHEIADNIYNKLTGELGYFKSKILFIDESGKPSNPTKKIAIMDQDGANLHYLTNGNQLVVSPKFLNKKSQIAYTGYVNDTPLTYVQELVTGERKIIGMFNNGAIAPTFSPADPTLVLSVLKENGNSNLFSINIQSNNLKRLTYTDSIDTVSCFSPDGANIVFSSDRTGKQKLYIMNKDGSDLKEISKNKGSYSTPSWSPDGNYIAFTKKTPKGFSIGIMHKDGSDERILTTSFHSERPCWAPNSRLIMFFKEVAPAVHKLYIIDINGHKEHLIRTPNGASDPDWGLI